MLVKIDILNVKTRRGILCRRLSRTSCSTCSKVEVMIKIYHVVAFGLLDCHYTFSGSISLIKDFFSIHGIQEQEQEFSVE